MGVFAPPMGWCLHPIWGGGNACNWLKCAASTGVGIAGVGITGVGIAVCSQIHHVGIMRALKGQTLTPFNLS